jgi:hypothetical protein
MKMCLQISLKRAIEKERERKREKGEEATNASKFAYS